MQIAMAVRHNEIFMSAVNATEQIYVLRATMQATVPLVNSLTRTGWGQYKIFMLLIF